MKRLTIEDVAKSAGVSIGTVSAVINSKGTVSPKTMAHVLAVMKKMNFRPKGIARNLKNDSDAKSIGVLIKDINYPFYTTIAAGVKDYANKKGYIVVITSSENSHDAETKISKFFTTKDIKGAIIAPIIENNSEIEHLFNLKMLNYPFVLLEEVRGIQASVVTIDNLKAVRKSVKFLIELGHEKIVHFAGPTASSHTYERIEGFKQSFIKSSLVFDDSMIVQIGSNTDESYDKTLEYFKKLKREEYPTAIVCFNDQQAIGVLNALSDLNLSVPEDISVIGNDDIHYAKNLRVPLTTIRTPLREIGYKAAETLIRMIESPQPLEYQSKVLDTELVVRGSTTIRKTD